jgi:Xaa-Pro aminopeptidase
MTFPALTPEGCSDRCRHLTALFDGDLIIVSNPRNLYYYAGFLPPFPSLAQWGPVYLLLDAVEGKTTLLCHNFAEAAAEKSSTDNLQIWNWYDGVKNPDRDIYARGAAVLSEYLDSRYRSAKIGIEPGTFPLIPGIRSEECTDLAPLIGRQRRAKYPDELACIRAAQDAALAGHQAARREIRPGMSEIDLFNLICAAVTEVAGMPAMLIGDIISGPRTLEVSGGPTTRILEQGDTAILDLSPMVGGYRADYTATILVDAEPDQSQLNLERALHEAMETGRELLRPGVRAADVYRSVMDCMVKHGFGNGFTHHAGHGLGLDHPEAPFFVPGSDEELVAGDVVTLEPGCYEPGRSGRIEHVFLVGENGAEQLSRHDTRFARG